LILHVAVAECRLKDSATFPYLDGENDLSIAEVGLTKRELFAAMAMQGLLANPATDGTYSQIADDAVVYADQLIKELNQTSGSRGNIDSTNSSTTSTVRFNHQLLVRLR
jgi:hypothetical protein